MSENKYSGNNSEFKKNFEKKSRGMSIFYIVLSVLVLLVLVAQAIQGNYDNCFTCLLTLVMFLIPSFVDKRLKIMLPNALEVVIILFIFFAQILGELREFYLIFPWWDTMLHTANGFLMAAIGFSMVDILNRSEAFKFQLSPIYVVMVAFCFSMTIGVIWEFFEFFMDYYFAMDMQKDTILSAISSVDFHPDHANIPVRIEGIEDVVLVGNNLMVDGALQENYAMNLGGYLDIGIIDTIQDLFVNFIGAVVFSVIGFVYLKRRKGGIVAQLVPSLKKKEEEE